MKKLIAIAFLFISINSFSQFADNGKRIFNVLNFGAKGDAKVLTDGVTNGTTTFTSATASFSSATDVGKLIRITGAAGSGNDLITTIASVTNSTTVVLTVGASTSASALSFDFGTNNTTAIRNAANAVPTTGGTVYFPMGYYLKNGLINFPNPTLVTGEMSGRQSPTYDSSSTLTPHSKIIEVGVNLSASVTIQSSGSIWQDLDLVCDNGATATSGICLNINAQCVSIYRSLIGSNAWIACAQNYSWLWKIDQCGFFGIQHGLLIRNLTLADAGDWSVVNTFFGGVVAGHPMSSAVLIQSSGGMKFVNNKFAGTMHKCISVEITSSASNTSDFQIANNSFENFDSCGINIICKGGAVFSNVQMTGNQIAPYVAHATGININGTGQGAFFKGMTIVGNTLYNQFTGDTAIKVTAVQNIQIANNEINGSWTLPVWIDGTSTNVDWVGPTQVAVGTTANGTSGSAELVYTTSNGFLDLTKNQSNASGIRATNTTANAASLAFIRATSSTYLSQIIQYSSSTTTYGALVANAGGFYTNSTTGVAMVDNAAGKFQIAVGSTPSAMATFFAGGLVTMGSTTDNSTGELQLTNSVRSQLALHYDNSNYTQFLTTSGGLLDIAPTGLHAQFVAHAEPFTTATYDLGTSSLVWRDVFHRHLIPKGTAPTTGTLGSNITSATVGANCTDESCLVTIVSSGICTGAIFQLTYNVAWPNTPTPVISEGNNPTGGTQTYFKAYGVSTSVTQVTGFLPSAGTYIVNIHTEP